MIIDSEAIPEDLKARPQWVGWRTEVRNGNPTKPPYSAVTGGLASHANPNTWTTFREAIAFKQRHPDVEGVGFVFTKGDEYAGIDLDKCRDPETGTIADRAQQIIDKMSSYTEVSPNGTGLHIIVCGKVPGGVKRNGVEIYDQLRYFTVTGQHLPGTPPTVERRYEELTALYEEVAPPPEPQMPRTAPGYVDVADAELLEKARASEKGERFRALYDRGEWAAGYESQSNADLALCSDLAFWTDRDAGRIDRLFRSSSLMRPKWDERHFGDGRTYGEATVELATSGVSSGYSPSFSTPIIDETEYRAAVEGAEQKRDEDASEEASAAAEYVCPAAPGSFIAEYVRYAAGRTDAPPEAHELMAVGMLSALAGPGPRLGMAAHVDGGSLCVWTLYVVDSTVGRKSTVLNFAVDIVKQVLGSQAVIPWEGSPQGIIQRLVERDGKSAVFVRDEYSGLMRQMKAAGGHMAGLEQVFIRAYDGGVIENIRTKKRTNKKDIDGNAVYEKDTDRVENPYLVKLCASTRTALVERCSIDDVISGFLPRFVVVSGSAAPKPPVPVTPEMEAQRRALVLHARSFHEKAIRLRELELDPVVLEMSWGLEQAWMATARDMRSDTGTPSLKRLADTVLKTAALIAIDEDRTGEPVVRPSHFSQAMLLGERWVVSTVGLIDELGTTTFMREVEAVAASVRQHPGVTMSGLLRRHRGLRKRDFEEVLITLQMRDEIEKVTVKTNGRPSDTFFPFGYKESTEEREERETTHNEGSK